MVRSVLLFFKDRFQWVARARGMVQPSSLLGAGVHQEGGGDAAQKTDPFLPGLQASRSMESIRSCGGESWRSSRRTTRPSQETGKSCQDALYPACQVRGEPDASKRIEVPPQRREKKPRM
jgi:hypothetical protein